MTNPYQTPDSEILSSIDRPQRPFSVKIAVVLFIAITILSAIGIFMFGGVKALKTEDISSLFLAYIIILIGLTLTYNGFNWARILFIIYLVIKSCFRAWFVVTAMSSAVISIKLFAFVLIALEVLTIYFLLHKNTFKWYAEVKKYRAR